MARVVEKPLASSPLILDYRPAQRVIQTTNILLFVTTTVSLSQEGRTANYCLHYWWACTIVRSDKAVLL